MRSVYLPQLCPEGESVIITEREQLHHLSTVVRLRPCEKILALNGAGLKVFCTATSIEKNAITLTINSHEVVAPLSQLDLLLAPPKRPALEEIVRQSTELGIGNIFLLQSQFAQEVEIGEGKSRFLKIIESAMIQSNNPFFTKFEQTIPFADLEIFLKQAKYEKIFYFTSLASTAAFPSPALPLTKKDKTLFIIGPEGGFSTEEESYFSNNPQISKHHLNSYILKAQTAVVAAAGFLLGSQSNE